MIKKTKSLYTLAIVGVLAVSTTLPVANALEAPQNTEKEGYTIPLTKIVDPVTDPTNILPQLNPFAKGVTSLLEPKPYETYALQPNQPTQTTQTTQTNRLVMLSETYVSDTKDETANTIIATIEAETEMKLQEMEPSVTFETNQTLITQAETLKETANELQSQAASLSTSIQEELERLKVERMAREYQESLNEPSIASFTAQTVEDHTRLRGVYTQAKEIEQRILTSEPSDHFKAFVESAKVHQFEGYDARTRSNLSGEDLERFLVGTDMQGLGQAYANAEQQHGVSAVVLLALSAHESGWGKSKLAREKNNIFGYMAYDRDPYNSAKHFETQEEGILTVASHLSRNYLTSGAKYYNGYTLQGMNVKYASDMEWAEKITGIMNRLVSKF